jgi:hypothetical protein
LASEQKSPPGQQMMSVSRPMFGVASPICAWRLPQREQVALLFTSASTRFCSWVTRSSPKAVAVGQVGDRPSAGRWRRPAAVPVGFSDRVTMA